MSHDINHTDAQHTDGPNIKVAQNQIFLPPLTFKNTVGSPVTQVAGSRFPCYQFPDSADSQVNIAFQENIPAGWTTFKIELYHANPNAGTGNVTLTVTTSVVAVGGDLTAGDSVLYGPTDTAAGSQSILTSLVVSSSVAVATNKLRHVRILRQGAAAGDTLVGAWNFLGLLLTKVT